MWFTHIYVHVGRSPLVYGAPCEMLYITPNWPILLDQSGFLSSFPYYNCCFYLCVFGMFISFFFLIITIVASSIFSFRSRSRWHRLLRLALSTQLESSYQSLRYISQRRSLIYIWQLSCNFLSLFFSFCIFSRCVALHFNCGCMALKIWTVLFFENTDCFRSVDLIMIMYLFIPSFLPQMADPLVITSWL